MFGLFLFVCVSYMVWRIVTDFETMALYFGVLLFFAVIAMGSFWFLGFGFNGVNLFVWWFVFLFSDCLSGITNRNNLLGNLERL